MTKFKSANEFVEEKLQDLMLALEEASNADCLTYAGPIAFGADDAIRNAVENLSGKKSKLMFVLETPGGFAETARRISDIVRHHYCIVDFIVPSYAMSAGTILVMSGDAIHMDYYSVLGPIDPQIEGPDGKLIPALGYLFRYEEMLTKANNGDISETELQILLSFDQGQLYAYEQARDLSRSLLEEWLVKYKFKDWNITTSSQRPVSEEMKRHRAKEIADKLNDAKRWNSHGIGINMEKIREELNLRIDDFGANQELNFAIRSYHRLLVDYMGKMGASCAVHTRSEFTRLRV